MLPTMRMSISARSAGRALTASRAFHRRSRATPTTSQPSLLDLLMQIQSDNGLIFDNQYFPLHVPSSFRWPSCNDPGNCVAKEPLGNLP